MDEVNLVLVGINVTILTLLLSLASVVLYSLVLLRYNIKVRCGTPPVGRCTVAYKYLTGPYRNIWDTFNEASSIDPTLKTIAVYYDNPTVVEDESLRAGVGCILAEGEKTADPKVVDKYIAMGYHLCTFPAITSAVYTQFPFKSYWAMTVADYKVYPALCNYLDMNSLTGHPFIEIYEPSRIVYVMPLMHHEDFYVPETEGKQSDQFGSLPVPPPTDTTMGTQAAGIGESVSHGDKKTK